MKKIDAHTHTHYCPHGSGDHVEDMIHRAVELGFDEYHITEHPPLPTSFTEQLVPKEAIETLTMNEQQTEDYIREMLLLKEKYRHVITLKVGFEMDYLPEHTEWTKQFLNEYGKYCDTGLLSVHFMKGNGGWRCVDYKAEDTKEGLVDYYGSVENFQLAYYDYVQQSVLADLGPYKPTRIGHMTLCNKFQNYLHIQQNELVDKKIEETLIVVRDNGYTLDLNTAGLFKPYCQQTYPTTSVIQKATALRIPFLYGSDSHGVKDVGRGYESIVDYLTK
ncbi:MAG: histidinol-phosphatase HisJ [Bacillaceae bacterium]